MTAESRRVIEGFVKGTFEARLDDQYGRGEGKNHVLWFKNWVSLQSVRGVDHVHVLVRDAPEDLLEAWTA